MIGNRSVFIKIALLTAAGLVLLLTGLFLGTKFKPSSSESSATIQAGPQNAEELFSAYPKLVKRAFIQQQIEGTVKSNNEDGLTVEAEDQSLTLTSKDIEKARYSRVPKTATGSASPAVPVEIKAGDVKTGDFILINRIIDWKTGQSSITGITVLPR